MEFKPEQLEFIEISGADNAVHLAKALEVYASNIQYFELFEPGEKDDMDLLADLRRDIETLPPKCLPDQKHIGYFTYEGKALALLDGISGYPQADTFFIGLFLVKKEFQRQGWGQDIYRSIENQVKDRGFQRIQLGVVDRNEGGQKFWASQGFLYLKTQEVAVNGGKTWSATMMEKEL